MGSGFSGSPASSLARLPHLDLGRLGDAGLGRGVDHLLQIRTCASGAQFCFDDGPGSAVSVQELK
ncbi:hypothetical protein [Streptomyces sp. NPDC057460]|uniref:hypothetical protein n=1 Tax=Streptomyces sp. NPDC057460 TaxID=3346141 RepID=UPI0036874E05